MTILFGGGDGGGIWVGPDGKIHHIPPWNPEVMRQLKAANAVLSAAAALNDKGVTNELSALGERLTAAAIPQILKAAGHAVAESKSVAFLDGDDGFVCGSTGKRPGHFPIPHGPEGVTREAIAFAGR